jgi:polyisoprenyl-teichoic acid--peptidoglycan teichoic acid transferase
MVQTLRRAWAWLLLVILLSLVSLLLMFLPGSTDTYQAANNLALPQAAIPNSGFEDAVHSATPTASRTAEVDARAPMDEGGLEPDDNAPAELMQAEPAPVQQPEEGTVTPALNFMPAITPTLALPTPAPWNGRERVTILVLGVDAREGEPGGGPPRTDTMILLTIDPVAKTAGMLSVPRDLWVEMPATTKSARINVAYRWGEQARLPGGGAGYAIRAVSGLMDVPIHYYLLLDFDAFTGFIDAMGGLKMHIREEIKVDPIGPGNTVILEPGVQTISGDVALGYARNRYTERGDFDRISRQQEVILAVRDQVLTFNMLPQLVYKAPAIYSSISDGLESNLTLDQFIRLAWLAAQIDEENIYRVSFEPRDLSFERIETESGPQDVLIPKAGRARVLREKFLSGP